MTLTEKELQIFTAQCLNIGESLYCAGSEISRIEDTINRLGRAYGATHMNVQAITSNIMVTVEFPGMPQQTQSRRITKSSGLDLEKLENLNDLCRRVANSPIPVEELRDAVDAIERVNPDPKVLFVGTVLAGSMFAVFFGGNAVDALVAGIIAAYIFFLKEKVGTHFTSGFYSNFVVSLLAALLLVVLYAFFPSLHTEEIMIGDIMVLVPGMAITNSIRYTLTGDSISGFEKLMESLIVAAGIALGISLAIMIGGAIL